LAFYEIRLFIKIFGILQCKEFVESGRKYGDSENEYEIDDLISFVRKSVNFEALRAYNLLDYMFIEKIW
jgi:hypothetical protein